MDHLQLLGAAPSGAARGDGPHVASKFVEIEHTKDKQGGNQNWMEFVKMLQQLHKVAPVMATKEVSVEVRFLFIFSDDEKDSVGFRGVCLKTAIGVLKKQRQNLQHLFPTVSTVMTLRI